MTLLNKDQILQVDDNKTKDVEVPEWGGTVRVKTMTGYDRDSFESEMIAGRKNDSDVNLMNFRARLASRCMVDDAGKRLFTDADTAALGRKSSAALDRIVDVAKSMNGMSDDDEAELTEGFDKAPGDNSSSE